jgi:spermidine synthase
MQRRLSLVLGPIFALTGFSALVLQVVWQRVISLHSGVDLSSFVTVVAAFLAGLGAGSLLGGWLADRLGPIRSLVAFSLANVGIGLYAWVSLILFYDVYRELAGGLQSQVASFLFNVAVLIVPTVLMGLSLPLVARAVTSRVDDAGPLIGRMYGINTIGAAAGAAVAGWVLLGTFGFQNVTRIAGTLNLIAAALIALVWRSIRSLPDQDEGAAAPATASTPDSPATAGAVETAGAAGTAAGGRSWPWFVVYGITGAVALAFEQLFFRLIDAEMRSNSYSFAHVLTLYLVLFGVGATIGSRLVRRARDPRRWFLWMQFSVGVTAMLAIVGLVRILPSIGFEAWLTEYFAGEGYNGGFGKDLGLRDWAKIGVVYLAVPLGIMGLPVLLMGASFPFVQAIIARDVATLGRRTGALLFTNTCGNVAGTLLSGFVFIDAFGTAGTYRLLTVVIAVVGFGAVFLTPVRRTQVLHGGLAVAVVATVLVASPSNQRLWSFLHGVPDSQMTVAEDHSCATTLKYFDDGGAYLTINGSGQNGHPFDDFHVLIGTLPTVVQPDPQHALAIGFGAGSTTYAMLQDPRLDDITTVELCGGAYDLAHHLADQGRQDFIRMRTDPRYVEKVGDGRKHLLVTDERYDIVTVDTLRPTSAFSGSLYSKEFYELVDSRLHDSGVVAQWIPTIRTLNTISSVFPYISLFRVDSYNEGALFVLASRSPIDLDAGRLVERFRLTPKESYTDAQRARLEQFLREAPRYCVRNGERLTGVDRVHKNFDLRPRDEYFLNNGDAPDLATACR